MVEGEASNEPREPLVIPGELSKENIRQKMWDYIEKHNLADAPRPVFNRIPNFKERNAAAERILDLEAFQKAHTVKINPDKPQEWARFLSLQAQKDLLVPTPRLRGGLFNRILPKSPEKDALKMCATTQGIRKFSKPVGLDAKVKVDLIVSGSVAVSRRGYRIGKGEGFADLEYAMMRSMGAVDADTLIVTTAHDCQVIDIPESLMEDHDFMVDFILTPTQVIKCDRNRSQPTGVIWSKMSPRKLSKIPILKELREKEKGEGKDVELKQPSSESEGEDDERFQRPLRKRQDRNRRLRRNRGGGKARDGGRERSDLAVKYDFDKEQREVSVRDRDGEASDGDLKPLGASNRPPNDRRRMRKPRLPRYGGMRRGKDSGGSDGERSPERDSDRENSPSDGERRDRGVGRRYRRRERTYSGENGPRRNYRYGYRNRGPFRRYRGSPRKGEDFKPTVYVGNLPMSVRVSAFKAAVRGKGVQPLAVLWKHGYAFLLMEDLSAAKSAVNTLLDIEFDGQGVKVELSRLSQERERSGDVEGHEGRGFNGEEGMKLKQEERESDHKEGLVEGEN